MYVEGDVPYVANGCYGNNGFGFGNGWEGLIGLALVAGLFGGWGGNGFGFGGRGYGAGSEGDSGRYLRQQVPHRQQGWLAELLRYAQAECRASD